MLLPSKGLAVHFLNGPWQSNRPTVFGSHAENVFASFMIGKDWILLSLNDIGPYTHYMIK